MIPEGSPVYTAQGVMYERENRRRPPESERRGRPAPPPRKKKKAFNFDKFILGVKTFFIRLGIMILAFLVLGAWWYGSVFHSEASRRRGQVTFVMEDTGSYTEKAKSAYRGDVLYVDLTEISSWLGMVSVGSVSSMRFICTGGPSDSSSGKGGEEYAIFTDRSQTVIINGRSIILEDVCRTEDSHILVPLSFVETYMSGITVERDLKGTRVEIVPEGAGDEESEEETEVKVSFKVKGPVTIAPVEYPE